MMGFLRAHGWEIGRLTFDQRNTHVGVEHPLHALAIINSKSHGAIVLLVQVWP